jgi:outer membrane lipoprotein carrier protein
MIRNVCFSIILISLTCHGIAQTKSKPSAVRDADALKVLQKIRAEFDQAKTLEIQFELEMEYPGSEKEKQSGTLQQSGKKYRVNTSQITMVSDGKSLWFVNKASKEGQITSIDNDDMNLYSPLELIKIYERDDHNFAITNEYKDKGISYLQIEFVPLDRGVDYSKARLTIEKQTNKVVDIRFFYRDGSRMVLSIKSMVKNKAIAPAQFNFNAAQFPGVYMEDLRS